MAKVQKDKRTPKTAEADAPTGGATAEEKAALARRDGGGELDEAERDEAERDEADAAEADAAEDAAEDVERAPSAVAEGDTEGADGEEDVAAAQLGNSRYVIAGFFASGMLLAYIVGKLVHGVWATLSNKDWFSRALPTLAAVADDDKTTYGTVLGGLVALVVVLRTYRNPEVRTWTDEVASELAKVKWPTKKEVTNSTFVVITATAVATVYLALLDRFWAFVTNIVYGDGS